MRNYWQILGLEEGASLDDVKKAYRTYAKKFHPDLHENDAFFTERFQEIQEAYEILSNALSGKEQEQDDNSVDETEGSNENYSEEQNNNIIEPQILYFTSSQESATLNDIITLSWATTNADKVYIQGLGEVDCIGNKKIKITNFRDGYCHFKITAYNQLQCVEMHIKIKKRENKTYTSSDKNVLSPKIIAFYSNKNIASENEQIILYWNVENASWVACSAIQGNLNCMGNRTIKISFNGAEQKTIYLYAGNKKEERVKKSLVIKKISPIIASFYSNKNFANDNERITLYWEVKNADTITCSEMPSYTNLHPTDSMTINISFDGAEQKTISLYAKKGEEVQVKSLEIIKKLNISSRESDTGIESKLKNTSDISCKKRKKKDGILLSIVWLVSIASIPVASIPSTSFANTYHPRELIINLANMICAFLVGVTIKKIPSIGYLFNVIFILFGIFFFVQIQLLGNSLIDQELNLLVNIFYMVFILIYGMIRITK